MRLAACLFLIVTLTFAQTDKATITGGSVTERLRLDFRRRVLQPAERDPLQLSQPDHQAYRRRDFVDGPFRAADPIRTETDLLTLERSTQ
jgi:hypothetical protein